MLLAAAFAAQAQTVVENFVPGSTLAGISYFLPRTAVRTPFRFREVRDWTRV